MTTSTTSNRPIFTNAIDIKPDLKDDIFLNNTIFIKAENRNDVFSSNIIKSRVLDIYNNSKKTYLHLSFNSFLYGLYLYEVNYPIISHQIRDNIFNSYCKYNNIDYDELLSILIKHFSIGNRKIGNNTLIYNITPQYNCPAQLQCKYINICYAKKAEYLYPATFAFRVRQQVLYNHLSSYMFSDAISILRKIHLKVKYIRFGESGDFKNERDIIKFRNIATITPLIFYCFTNRKDLKNKFISICFDADNIVLNGSSFMLNNKSIIVNKKPEKLGNNQVLCAGKCDECIGSHCRIKRNKEILIIKH